MGLVVEMLGGGMEGMWERGGYAVESIKRGRDFGYDCGG